jgi:DNA-binding beta-propeller fold protein YncE
MTRRTLALAALLLALGAGGAHAQDETPATQLALRPVAFFWSHLYDGNLRQPRGIFFDRSAGEVWVADTNNNLVGAFSPEGVPLFAFGGKGVLGEPVKVLSTPGGDVYVLDNDRSRVKVFSYRGEPRGTLPLPGVGEKPVIGTIALDADGNLYVGENESGQVLMYGPDLKLKLRFGSYGEDEGQFTAIGGIAPAADRIYVTDHQGIAVQVFDRKGNFVKGWGRHEMGSQNFSLPEGIAVDAKGRVFVIDAIRHEMKIFDGEGRVLDIYGGVGTGPGSLIYPLDVAADASGRIYVVEKGNGRVQVFAEEEVPAMGRKQ